MSPNLAANTTPASSTSYVVNILHSDSEVASAESDWNRLLVLDGSPNVFMSYGWFNAWIRQHAEESPSSRIAPFVLKLLQDGQVTGIAPLARRISSRALRIRKISFATHHSDYNDLMVGSDLDGQTSAIVEFLAKNKREWDLVDLRELRDTGDGCKSLEQALQRSGLPYRIFTEPEGCPFLRIEGNAATVMQRLSGHVRRTLRRRSEKAQDEDMRIRIIERPDLEPGLVDTLTALDWKKQAHRSSPVFFAAYPRAFKEVFEKLGPMNQLYVALLEIGNQPVAFQLGFRCGKKFWDYTKAYDRAYSRFAPGTLLLPALLDYCADGGFEEYDFLRGEEEYKLIWSSGIHRRFRVIVWNHRWTSRIKAALFLKYRTAQSQTD